MDFTLAALHPRVVIATAIVAVALVAWLRGRLLRRPMTTDRYLAMLRSAVERNSAPSHKHDATRPFQSAIRVLPHQPRRVEPERAGRAVLRNCKYNGALGRDPLPSGTKHDRRLRPAQPRH